MAIAEFHGSSTKATRVSQESFFSLRQEKLAHPINETHWVSVGYFASGDTPMCCSTPMCHGPVVENCCSSISFLLLWTISWVAFLWENRHTLSHLSHPAFSGLGSSGKEGRMLPLIRRWSPGYVSSSFSLSMGEQPIKTQGLSPTKCHPSSPLSASVAISVLHY